MTETTQVEEFAADQEEQTESTRSSIQAAVENLARGEATEADYELLTDRDAMNHATMAQALHVIETLRDRSTTAPVEVMWAAAVTLCTRVKQSPSFRRQLPGSANGPRKFRGPQWSQ